jgi:hypothetical protein
VVGFFILRDYLIAAFLFCQNRHLTFIFFFRVSYIILYFLVIVKRNGVEV